MSSHRRALPSRKSRHFHRKHLMSYSFSIDATTKAEAKDKVAAELDKVVQQQPIHVVDRKQARDAVEAFVSLLPDDDTKDLHVSVSGSVAWAGPQDEPVVTGANISIGVTLRTRSNTTSAP